MRKSRLKAGGRGIVLLLGMSALAGCETLGNPIDILSGKRTTPDEFQVVARKPLRMPGSLELPEPRLGEDSPLEPDPRTDAVVALLGGPVVSDGDAGGAGERALLEAAAAAASQGDTPAILEKKEAELESGGEYVPPSIFDVFRETDLPVEDQLDPAIESRRLQRDGVAPAPIDPAAQPESQQTRGDDDDLFYPRRSRPQNRLPSAPTETAF